MPLFTNSNADASDSVPLTSKHIDMLKDPTKVDDYSTFTECGWFCVLAFKDRRRVFYAHCNSVDEFQRLMNPNIGRDEFGERRIAELYAMGR